MLLGIVIITKVNGKILFGNVHGRLKGKIGT